jgi:hypothetical protein
VQSFKSDLSSIQSIDSSFRSCLARTENSSPIRRVSETLNTAANGHYASRLQQRHSHCFSRLIFLPHTSHPPQTHKEISEAYTYPPQPHHRPPHYLRRTPGGTPDSNKAPTPRRQHGYFCIALCVVDLVEEGDSDTDSGACSFSYTSSKSEQVLTTNVGQCRKDNVVVQTEGKDALEVAIMA